MRNPACPLCVTNLFHIIASFRAKELVDGWKTAFDIDISGELGHIDKLDLYACRHCGLQSFIPLGLAGSSRVYEGLEKLRWYYMARKWEYEVAINDLKGCENGLEVGCGAGYFIEQARTKHGMDMDGIELNPHAVEKARGRGLSVWNCDLEDAARRFAGKYDVVCGFQVLEHVSNPRDFLTWAVKLLKPGGRLSLGLPNADSYLKYQFNILDMPPHHVTRWNHQSLAFLAELFPMQLLHIKKESLADYHIADYLHARLSFWSPVGIAGGLCKQITTRLLFKLLGYKGVRKQLTGHALYACYQRTGDPI